MTIEQTVEIPVSHRLTIEIPEEIPAGRTQMIIQFPIREGAQTVDQGTGEAVPPEARGQSGNAAFRNALRNAYGAWKDNPWANHLEDINAMRDEWDHRDPWNTDPSKGHRN
jgi:hypothetical protein